MQKIRGRYAEATVYAKTIEEYAVSQIKHICDMKASAGSKIAVMPDVHPGKVGPIGFTMTVGEIVMPSLVGSDIGCGISYVKIRKTNIEFQKLDKVIREKIPAGGKIRKEAHRFSCDFDFDDLICRKYVDEKRARLSLGTLGGGNHFLEIDKDDEGDIYAVVHSGSRHLGKEVTDYYLGVGQNELKKKGIKIPYELTCLEGELMQDYLHDMKEIQGYAMLNREIILTEIVKSMKWKPVRYGECIHNYIDENRILRKGAAPAYEDDEVIIPVNMKDGMILGTGKGNADWNHSAPHGAGRIMNRSEVRNHHTVSEYRKVMEGIYSSTIGADTLDEAPFAYRGIDEIMETIKDTVEVTKILKPVYNFKAGEGR